MTPESCCSGFFSSFFSSVFLFFLTRLYGAVQKNKKNNSEKDGQIAALQEERGALQSQLAQLRAQVRQHQLDFRKGGALYQGIKHLRVPYIGVQRGARVPYIGVQRVRTRGQRQLIPPCGCGGRGIIMVTCEQVTKERKAYGEMVKRVGGEREVLLGAS